MKDVVQSMYLVFKAIYIEHIIFLYRLLIHYFKINLKIFQLIKLKYC